MRDFVDYDFAYKTAESKDVQGVNIVRMDQLLMENAFDERFDRPRGRFEEKEGKRAQLRFFFNLGKSVNKLISEFDSIG